ncbi:hypothetical protein ACFWJQ_18780 [Streptomyces goshikiensis]|uniref:hypothetical protein n=1 Tax=Streptomyces goshikiensis TaxID=1942 RepID=UPI00366612F6
MADDRAPTLRAREGPRTRSGGRRPWPPAAPDWNPTERGWTVDWQRHYAYLARLLDGGARLVAIVPGVTRHGEDIGR